MPIPVRPARACLPALLLAALLSAAGCATPYVRHAGADLGQVLHLGVGASRWPGLYVHARAPVFATSVGYLPAAIGAGSDYGAHGAWRQRGYGFLLGGRLVRVPFAVRLPPLSGSPPEEAYLDEGHFLVLALVTTDRRTPSATSVLNVRKLELGVHALFVGLSFGLDLAELGDALAGLVGWDALGDDVANDVAAGHLPPEALEDPAPAEEREDG